MKYIRKNIKDLKRRELYQQKEQEKNIYKMLRRNNLLTLTERNYYNNLIGLSKKDSSISRIKNRCIITGRSRGIITAYKVSRIQFKEYIKMGLINGIRKLSY